MARSKKGQAKAIAKQIPTRTVEYEGKSYDLAIVGKGRDIPDSEKLKIAELVCEMYSTDQYTIMESLAHCGIYSDHTWFNWMDKITEIATLYKEAQRKKDIRYRHRLKTRARTMAERLIDGYTVPSKEVRKEVIVLKDGTVIEDKGKQVIIEKEILIKPSVRLIEGVLSTHDTENYNPSGRQLNQQVQKEEYADWTDEQILAEIERLSK